MQTRTSMSERFQALPRVGGAGKVVGQEALEPL
jgi:hypothetical protein